MTRPVAAPSAPRHLRVAGLSLGLTCGGEGVAAAIDPAIDHLVTADPLPAGAPRWSAWESEERHPLWTADPVGPGRLPGGGLVVARPDPPVVEVARPDGSIDLWGAPAALTSGDVRAHPASTALAHVLAARGATVLHAGAVAWDGSAALVLGPSGAGKSTTVLACVAAGADYLGDDLCVLTTDGARPEIHALYATAKVTLESGRALGGLAGPTLGSTPKGKRVVGMAVPAAVAPVGALVVLTAPGRPVPPERVEAGRAVRGLTATALKAGLGAGSLAGWLHAAADLARRVPTFAVTPSWDLARVAADVRRAVEQGADAKERT